MIAIGAQDPCFFGEVQINARMSLYIAAVTKSGFLVDIDNRVAFFIGAGSDEHGGLPFQNTFVGPD